MMRRLSCPGARRICSLMQSKLLLMMAAMALPSFALAQAKPPAHAPAHAPVAQAPAAQAPTHAASRPASSAPKLIGKFDDWQAATHQEAGQQVCYAFARVASSQPVLPGRGDVVLTVTQRDGGRDAVAISAGFAYAANTEVQMGVDQAVLAFYTANRSAFARDGKAAVAAFGKGRQAVAKSPGPRGVTIADTFSLRGFSAAYTAINKACPPK
jgi:hypothetical protein